MTLSLPVAGMGKVEILPPLIKKEYSASFASPPMGGAGVDQPSRSASMPGVVAGSPLACAEVRAEESTVPTISSVDSLKGCKRFIMGCVQVDLLVLFGERSLFSIRKRTGSGYLPRGVITRGRSCRPGDPSASNARSVGRPTFPTIRTYPMKFTAKQIADLLDGTVEGDPSASVDRLSKIEEGGAGSLSFLANPAYTQYVYATTASVVIIGRDFSLSAPVKTTLVRVADAQGAFAKVL